MKSLTERLIQTAACSRQFLDAGSRADIARFILSRQNPDGGFRGRGAESDLYYTVFAAASLKVLGHPVPALRIWKFIHSFGLGDGLDFIHLVCLIRLKSAFPLFGSTRRKLFQRLEKHSAESAYGLFLKLLAEDSLGSADFPAEDLMVSQNDPTTNLAAAVLVNQQAGRDAETILLNRANKGGGFNPSEQVEVPDLLSTATALFALTSSGADLGEMHQPCCAFVESLWRDSGGFAGHVADEFEDVEYTFYALLTIGAVTQDLSSK